MVDDAWRQRAGGRSEKAISQRVLIIRLALQHTGFLNVLFSRHSRSSVSQLRHEIQFVS
jgi:hypothetical protein